jgi:hypothetical protein
VRVIGRLFKGLFVGLVLGGVLGAVAVKALGVTVMGTLMAYLLALVLGALTGLVAGKPIWAAGAKVEAGLKAFAGALLAAGGMFALRHWVGWSVDLTALGAGSGTLGELSATSLPLISAVLAMLFELDNTGESAAAPPGKKRVDTPDVGELTDADADAEELEQSGRRNARRS